MAQNRLWSDWLERTIRLEREKFKYIILPEYITKDKNLTDKEKNIYSMILTLSKNQECIMTNAYISEMLNISKVHASRLISSLRDKGYIKVKIIYKQNSRQVLKREFLLLLTSVLIPINKMRQDLLIQMLKI